MAHPRAIRKLAFLALFQMDAHIGGGASSGGTTPAAGDEDIRRWLDQHDASDSGAEGGVSPELKAKDRAAALELAKAAFAGRQAADAALTELAPAWPAHRQAAVDRALLRLAHHEILAGKTPPKVVINEVIELAKEFSTERSPAFINGLLDKVWKQAEATKAAKSGGGAAGVGPASGATDSTGSTAG